MHVGEVVECLVWAADLTNFGLTMRVSDESEPREREETYLLKKRESSSENMMLYLKI